MSLRRTYRIKCDSCGGIHWTEPGAKHDAPYSTPRHARAAAKYDGWQRIKIVTGQSSFPDKDEPSGVFVYDVMAGRDFCPACAEKERR